jgi:glutaredoxin
MITLYQAEWCPWCHRVRQALTELGLTYTNVNVSLKREDRAEVVRVSGQETVPVLKDGRRVISDSEEILAYLRATYDPPGDADDHVATGLFRYARSFRARPAVMLERLKKALDGEGFKVLAEIRGDAISSDLPPEYVLLEVAVPEVALTVIATDATAPSAVTVPMTVFPTDKGSAVAISDPSVGAWLYGVPDLLRATYPLKARAVEVLEKL